MNKLFGYVLMEEAATTTDGGGAGGGTQTTTDGGTQTPTDGGDKGAITGDDDDKGGTQTTTDDDDKGAITGDNNDGDADQIDWENITDEDYLKKVGLPDGQQWDADNMKEYTKLLKQYKIDPKAFRSFVDKSAELDKARTEKINAEHAKQKEEATKAFKQAGEDFRKEYTPEQVKEMNETLKGIDDDTFKVLVAKSPLSNNKTMGKMLLAYRQVYGEANGGEGAGKGSGGEKTFEQVWTGKA